MNAASSILRIGLCTLCVVGGIWAQPAAAAAGELDPTFGFGGEFRVEIDLTASSNNVYPTGIALQSDNKLVIVADGSGSFLVRMWPWGERDRFGLDSRIVTVEQPRGVLVQPDGKIVVAGGRTSFLIARYTADGKADLSFGTSGIVTQAFATTPPGFASAAGVVMQPDGKLVVAGRAGRSIALLRLNPSGSLDPNFGSGGTVVTSYPGGDVRATAIALTADGKLAVAANYSNEAGNTSHWLTARYNSDGTLDASFGGSGLVSTSLGSNVELARNIVVQEDGKLVVAGDGGNGGAVVRYNVDGSLDASFGIAGMALLVAAGAHGLMLQPDGKLLVGIGMIDGRMSAVRLLASGGVDPSYAAPALLTVGDGTTISSAVLMPEGKLVLGASLKVAFENRVDLGFARLQGDDITGTVVEFYNTLLDHFFVTANPAEQGSIDAGGSGPGWTRTALDFKSGGNSRVCRYYGTPGRGPNSHFFTVDERECLQARGDPGWHFEGYDFGASPPLPYCLVDGCETGTFWKCPTGTVPVYRAYNNRFALNDSNHRLTTDLAAYDAMIASGWRAEGLAMCVPA